MASNLHLSLIPIVFLNANITDKSIQTFGLFRDFGEMEQTGVRGEARAKLKNWRVPVRVPLPLEPDRYPTANRATAGAELGKNLSIFGVGLEIQKIARIKYGLSAQRQSEAG
jgi:hypothetical protein